MGFKEQMQKDNQTVFFNTAEFAESMNLVTVEGNEATIKVVRQGATERIVIDPGQGDSDTFMVMASEYAAPVPNDLITDAEEREWVVQTGCSKNSVSGIWTIPVACNRRVRG